MLYSIFKLVCKGDNLLLRVNEISHYINLLSNPVESESLPPLQLSLCFHVQLPPNMAVQNLFELLKQASEGPSDHGISVCKEGIVSFMTYGDLLVSTKQASMRLQHLKRIDAKVVLMYFTNHLHGIYWFWAIVAAGGIPCICPPLSKDLGQRQKIVRHLQELLENPIVITAPSLAPELLGLEGLQVISTGKSYSHHCENLNVWLGPG